MDSIATQTFGNLFGVPGTVHDVKVPSGTAALSRGDIMKRDLSAAIAAGGSNTGNGTAGTCTAQEHARIGAYVLTCITLAGVISAGAVTAGGSNVGDGTPGTATPGDGVKAGTYTLTCIAGITDVDHIRIEDLAANADISAREVFVPPTAGEFVAIGILTEGAPAGVDDSNTCVIAVKDSAGNTVVSKTYNTGTQPPSSDYESLGTLDTTHKLFTADEHFTLDVTQGTTADMPAFSLVLLYKCAGDTANVGTFKVEDPDGYRLEDLTVAAAYSNEHFGLTIADGAADFAPGDTFTIAMTLNASASVFQVLDPDGLMLPNLTVGVAYDNDHFSVTISDGATDFVAGDTFTVTVSDAGTCTEADDPQNMLAGILLEDTDASAADAYGSVNVHGGEVLEASVNAPSGLTVAAFKRALKEQCDIQLVDRQQPA